MNARAGRRCVPAVSRRSRSSSFLGTHVIETTTEIRNSLGVQNDPSGRPTRHWQSPLGLGFQSSAGPADVHPLQDCRVRERMERYPRIARVLTANHYD